MIKMYGKAFIMYNISTWGEEVGVKNLLSVLAVLFVLSLPGGSQSAEPSSNKARLGMRSTANEQPVNKSRDNAVSRDRGSKNNLNGNARDRDNKFSGRNRDSGGDRHGKHHKHHHKRDNKFYPFFPPFGYYGYYSPYSDYYAEVDPDYPLGYGTTLGTSLERQSNLEVNQYFVKPPLEPRAQPYPAAGDTYAEEQYDAAYEYYAPPSSGSRVIYIWTDENGVDNYVNDPDLIPDGQIDNVRIMGGE